MPVSGVSSSQSTYTEQLEEMLERRAEEQRLANRESSQAATVDTPQAASAQQTQDNQAMTTQAPSPAQEIGKGGMLDVMA